MDRSLRAALALHDWSRTIRSVRFGLGLCGLMPLLAACGGGGGCPSAASPATSRADWEAALDAKPELHADARGTITIKRDVHNVVFAADADKVAAAFDQVMRDSKRHFGMIEIDRKQADLDKPFVVGSRFQGRYLVQNASSVLQDLDKYEPAHEAICRIENTDTSDFGIIAVLDLNPPPGQDYVLVYHYLQGSPIAGSSRFVVHQISPGVSQLTQIFEYQEQTATFAAFFANGGLTLHDQVVASQASQTAAFASVKILSSDIPIEYQLP